MKFDSTLSPVFNRGVPPVAFLEELVSWAQDAPDEIFSLKYGSIKEPDIFTSLSWRKKFNGNYSRKAMMCEVLRVLAGFESSWDWNEGRDITNSESFKPETTEAGIFQVSANSMNFDRSLRYLFDLLFDDPPSGGNKRAEIFQIQTKKNHSFAIEYCARLLRFTIRHHGPLVRGDVFKEMSLDAILEFEELLSSESEKEPETNMEKIPIVIDPGHGGKDSGAKGKLRGITFKEAYLALDISIRLKNLLAKDGRFHVSATRNTDKFVELDQRAKIANLLGADLLSIHLNSSESGKGTGFEAFTTRGETESDTMATYLLTRYLDEFEGELRPRFDRSDGDIDKEAGFAVLRKTDRRAVLFELGFINNPHDLEIMVISANRQRMARALYLGLLDFYKLEELSEPMPGEDAPNSPTAPFPQTPKDPTPPVDAPLAPEKVRFSDALAVMETSTGLIEKEGIELLMQGDQQAGYEKIGMAASLFNAVKFLSPVTSEAGE